VISTAKGIWTEMGDELIHKREEGLREWPREDIRGNYPCVGRPFRPL